MHVGILLRVSIKTSSVKLCIMSRISNSHITRKIGSIAIIQTAMIVLSPSRNGVIMIKLKGRHFKRDMILQSVRWYLENRDQNTVFL